MASRCNVLSPLVYLISATLFSAPPLCAHQQSDPQTHASASLEDSPCLAASPKACLELALQAMGGHDRLSAIESLRLDEIGHSLLVEQSYRQDPFITSYERTHETLDFKKNRVRRETHLTWPESDPNQSESDSILIVTRTSGVYHSPKQDTPCGLRDIESADDALTFNLARLLLAAFAASDLHFESPRALRSTPHAVLAFTVRGIPTRILLNSFNHLPDAIETTRDFHDFWYFWGDVSQRIYFDGYQVFHGLVFPTNFVEERNGTLWRSTQLLNLEVNVPTDDSLFAMDEKAAAQSTKGKGWERPFVAAQVTQLAPGLTLYPGAWNSTVVQGGDGLYILEAPISGIYTQGLFDETKKLHPGVVVKAVLSTSDSWPHVGGVRQVVALGLPVYILDLNRPLLDRMIAAPHARHPDLLAQSLRQPDWRIVSKKVLVGSGLNRMELYPLRGASTERQYMVYFPEHKLLYASDTLSLNDDGSLYDPELMREVMQAVKREGLEVTTVFAMHQGPTPWSQIESLLRAAGVFL